MRSYILGNDGYNYTAGYFTSNKWINSNKIVLARSQLSDIGQQSREAQLVVLELDTMAVKLICEDLSEWGNYTVFGSRIYYLTKNELKLYDTENGETEILYKTDREIAGSPHITRDGRYISLFSYSDDCGMHCFRFDTELKIMEKIFEKKFRAPFPVANHVMICPTDKDLFFFAHEGNTEYISNRLWLYDHKSKTMRNIAKQSLNENGDISECYGHEAWSHNGEGLYFVKYDLSPEKPHGICYVNANSGHADRLYGKYKYWHVSDSYDGAYLTADTRFPGKESEIVLIHIASGEERVVDIVPTSKTHPCHPHPMISPDNKKIACTSLDSMGNTCVKIIFL